MGKRAGPRTLLSEAAALRRLPVTRNRRHDRQQTRELGREPSPEPAPDPIRIAVLAIKSLGPASLRACFTGTEVRVVVADPTIAAIFRAAITETARTRPTDRLIRIVTG